MAGIIPAVGDMLQIRVNCKAAEQLSQNVLHYRVTSAGGGGLNLQQIADAFRPHVDNEYKAWMPITADFQNVSVQNLSPPRTNPFISSAAPSAGTAIGDLVPRQASGLISTRTALGGRANHGRVYVGFMTDNNVDADGNITGGGTANLQTLADKLGPVVNLAFGGITNTLQLVVRHPDVLPGPVPQGTDVILMTARGYIATQRRRGDFGRPNF